MPFRTRNPYYLRISERNVLPLYLYLDERHLDWMSDVTLQHVLSDIRPHIIPKLKAEANLLSGVAQSSSSKKATVDTHRGETYQFCYFIRKTEPHSVVVKTRDFITVPPEKKSKMLPPPIPAPLNPQKGKRKAKSTKGSSGNARKKPKTKGKGKARQIQEEIEISSSDDDDDDNDHYISSYEGHTQGPRRSRRNTKLLPKGYQEVDDENASLQENSAEDQSIEMDNNPQSLSHDDTSLAMDVDIELDEEEEKPKPMLRLRCQGFSIYGHCLCVVVEPWPPIRTMSRAPSIAQSLSRAPSIAPPNFASTSVANIRAKTPLFLPDETDRERSETPAPFQGRKVLPPVPLFEGTSFFDDSDDSDDGGMMELSQVLRATGEHRAGAVDDDEDVDTSMFFGDADENREL